MSSERGGGFLESGSGGPPSVVAQYCSRLVDEYDYLLGLRDSYHREIEQLKLERDSLGRYQSSSTQMALELNLRVHKEAEVGHRLIRILQSCLEEVSPEKRGRYEELITRAQKVSISSIQERIMEMREGELLFGRKGRSGVPSRATASADRFEALSGGYSSHAARRQIADQFQDVMHVDIDLMDEATAQEHLPPGWGQWQQTAGESGGVGEEEVGRRRERGAEAISHPSSQPISQQSKASQPPQPQGSTTEEVPAMQHAGAVKEGQTQMEVDGEVEVDRDDAPIEMKDLMESTTEKIDDQMMKTEERKESEDDALGVNDGIDGIDGKDGEFKMSEVVIRGEDVGADSGTKMTVEGVMEEHRASVPSEQTMRQEMSEEGVVNEGVRALEEKDEEKGDLIVEEKKISTVGQVEVKDVNDRDRKEETELDAV